MKVTPLYDPAKGPMPVIGYMSGTGSNLKKLIEDSRKCGMYEFIGIVTDKSAAEGSNAVAICEQFGLPPAVESSLSQRLSYWYGEGSRFHGPDDPHRADFDRMTLNALEEMLQKSGTRRKLDTRGIKMPVAAFGGYMVLASPVLFESMLCINVHPADLSILRPNGKPKYRGAHAVEAAIAAGEQYLRATTHIVERDPDCGARLLISRGSPVDPKKSVDENQGALKKVGDHIIFPATMLYIAMGRVGRDEHGVICFDGMPIPNGIRLEDITIPEHLSHE